MYKETQRLIGQETNIRIATQKDAEILAILAKKAFKGYPFEYVFSSQGVKIAIENGEKRYVAYDLNDQVLGSAVLGLNETPMAEIMRVMIDPNERKNGVATILTRELSLEAISSGKYSWADVRGDQVGMQRAALSSGLKAISLETGKHVVYSHLDDGKETGSARETMVHMTTLPIDELNLKKQLTQLDGQIRRGLVINLSKALNPSPKNKEVTDYVLSTPTTTKERILKSFRENVNSYDSLIQLTNDIVKISVSGSEAIVVLPDSSSFIIKGNNLNPLLTLMEKVGIQITTYYENLNSPNEGYLVACGLEPGSIRPWINENTNEPIWQIAWRKTANHYEESLHGVALDPIVQRQLLKLIKLIDKI